MREGGIMKKSQFVIQQEGRTINNILLYSSFSTSMVEMEKTMFSDIFEKERYDLYPNEVEQLYEMGFLIDDDYDELKLFVQLRHVMQGAIIALKKELFKNIWITI